MSILIVDDDAELRATIAEILKQEGFVSEAFGDAREALHHLRHSELPNLILLDLGLPGLDGAAFRARQLADKRLAGVPVIIISAEADGARIAKRLGAADFLAKPFPPEELMHVVQNRALTLTRVDHFLRGALRGR